MERYGRAPYRPRRPPIRRINTTITGETLPALDRMVEVAEELGVDAIGVNHLMYATRDEVEKTARLACDGDISAVSTFVTSDAGIEPATVGLGAAWSAVAEFADAPARAAGTVVTDEGDGGTKIADYLSEQKFI